MVDGKRRRWIRGQTSHGGKRCNQSSSPGNSDDHDGTGCIAVAEVEEEESLRRSIPDSLLRKEDVKAVVVVDTMDIRVGVEEDILRDGATEDTPEAAEVLMDIPVAEDTEIGNLTDLINARREI